MSMVPFLLLKEQEAKKRNSFSQKNQTSSSEDTNYEKRYNLYQHILFLCREDKKLASFFEILAQNKDELEKENEANYMKQFDEAAIEYLKTEKQLIKSIEKIKELGIELTEEFRTPTHYCAVIPDIGEGFNKSKTGISYNKDKSFCSGFNGIHITKEMLLEDEKNPYKEEVSQWNLIEKDILKEEQKLITELNQQKKKLIWSIFNKKEVKAEIDDLESKLKEVQHQKQEGLEKKRKLEIFENLTTEQRIVLLEYFKLVDSCEKLGENIKTGVSGIILISTYYTTNEKRLSALWEKAFETTLKTDYIGMNEEVKYVDDILIKKFASYDNNTSFSDKIYNTGCENISPEERNTYFAIKGYIDILIRKNKAKLIVENKEEVSLTAKHK